MSWMQQLYPFIASIKSIWDRQRTALKVLSGVSLYLSIRYVYIKIHRKYTKMPPGPVGLPVLGSLLTLAASSHDFYIDLVKNTNFKLYTVPMGIVTAIYINDSKLVKQIFSMDCCHYRPKNQTIRNGNLSSIEGSDDWPQRRRFFQSNLITMLNKKFVQQNMKHLVNKMIVPKLRECELNNKLYFCHNDFQYVTFNIMYNCLFGGYLPENDKLYLKYVKTFDRYIQETLFHVLRYFAFGERFTTFLRNFQYFNKMDNIYDELLSVVKEWAKAAHLKYDADHIQTYYDITYKQLQLAAMQNGDIGDNWDSIMTRSVLADFEVAVAGGTDTTAATLDFCIAIAVKHEAVQDEIYNEIKDIIKETDIDEYDVFGNLMLFKKVRAFVQESLRLMPIIPVGLPKQVRKKGGVKIEIDDNEYIIPDGCVVFANIIGMQRNPKVWQNPNEFNINRWLSGGGDGKYVTKHNPYIMNFSYGRRNCPGETLALKSLYLMIAMLFFKYKFYYDEPGKVEIKLKSTVLLHVDPAIGCKVKRRE